MCYVKWGKIMNTIDLIKNKIYKGEDLDVNEIEYIKHNIDTILKREDYVDFLYSITDLEFIKKIILERKNKESRGNTKCM